jgi:hypothetical protein
MRFDFAQRSLTLSRSPLIPKSADAVPLIDLRPIGDPVQHYATAARSVVTGGRILSTVPNPATGLPKDIYVIFDTGTTGIQCSYIARL